MIRNRLKIAAIGGASVVGALGAAVAAHAQDYSASTTAAITAGGEAVISNFFTNLPVILGFIVAIVVTLWGIRWVLSHFRGGRR